MYSSGGNYWPGTLVALKPDERPALLREEYERAARDDRDGAVTVWVHARLVAQGMEPAPSQRYVPASALPDRGVEIHRFVWGRAAVFYALFMARGEKYVGVVRFATVDRRARSPGQAESDLLVERTVALIHAVGGSPGAS